MANYKRKKPRMKSLLKGNPKTSFWSRMIHKRWIRDYEDKKDRNKQTDE